jgi:hypothetical protein
LQRLQVGENVVGVLGNVGHDVDAADDAGIVDEERVPTRELRVLLVRRSNNVVGGADGAVDVAEEGVLKALSLGELEVLCRGVERCADNDAVGLGKPCGAVTQRLSFDRSTRRRRLGIPPHQHPVAAKIGKAHVVTVLVG